MYRNGSNPYLERIEIYVADLHRKRKFKFPQGNRNYDITLCIINNITSI